jgi:hypothetical protein
MGRNRACTQVDFGAQKEAWPAADGVDGGAAAEARVEGVGEARGAEGEERAAVDVEPVEEAVLDAREQVPHAGDAAGGAQQVGALGGTRPGFGPTRARRRGPTGRP